MARNLRKYKAYDDRTGRLERAIDLVNDGARPDLRVMRGEADKPHPQRIKIRIPPDRVAPRVITGEEFRYFYGYTLGANLWEQRSLPIVSWGLGSVVLSAIVQDPDQRFVLEDISGQFLLEDGVSYVVTE